MKDRLTGKERLMVDDELDVLNALEESLPMFAPKWKDHDKEFWKKFSCYA